MKTLKEKLQRLEAMYCISGIEGFTEAVLSLFNKQLQQAGEVAVEEYKKEEIKWKKFFKEDIENLFIPKCTICEKKATRQTERGKYEEENNGRPCNWGYYCDKCWKEGEEIEKEAMYGY